MISEPRDEVLTNSDLFSHARPHSRLKDLRPIESKTRYDSTNPRAILK
jgi:hypothetical protein